ncbi:16S rRNA (guanine(966)-N(2))-methyltransferase RsmD [Antrihabitans cavernicola]|uniref:16S rRNA (Guanine(966)-N(2))-methyltransferase RsmD n=1 Tax=Antrihabitans cavernicola TaxID=2495913 RepID=A0A5A7SDM6_9NOCA|nr:16S rRNA (guanine(966)-N(2))-methyltransferase RsmD [Spelaeibacter cavernicola]KAA0024258.1 16S rRNA (guanine(966)-N(2))-methyltransferase RsmD [Spelaeibacter cavernicola]
MPRIVAGVARGRRLQVPPAGTRPTSDRVREAVFNAIVSRIDLDGARVLDLYAGSGALGLEALSRGAGHVLLVESDAKAAGTVKDNAAVVNMPGSVVRVSSVAAVLATAPDEPYDLVFADPPYAVSDDSVESDLVALLAHSWVETDSVVALERSSRSPDTTWPAGYEVLRVRKYGEAKIELARVIATDSV